MSKPTSKSNITISCHRSCWWYFTHPYLQLVQNIKKGLNTLSCNVNVPILCSNNRGVQLLNKVNKPSLWLRTRKKIHLFFRTYTFFRRMEDWNITFSTHDAYIYSKLDFKQRKCFSRRDTFHVRFFASFIKKLRKSELMKVSWWAGTRI